MSQLQFMDSDLLVIFHLLFDVFMLDLKLFVFILWKVLPKKNKEMKQIKIKICSYC
jgi:hypothetical protein